MKKVKVIPNVPNVIVGGCITLMYLYICSDVDSLFFYNKIQSWRN